MRILFSLCFASALALAGPLLAQSHLTSIKVSAGPMSHTLQEIARQTGAELLFDRNLLMGLQAGKLDVNTTPLAALRSV